MLDARRVGVGHVGQTDRAGLWPWPVREGVAACVLLCLSIWHERDRPT